MSGRKYKNDISDIYGILREHQKNGTPISKTAIERAILELYGDFEKLSDTSIRLLEKTFADGDYETLYRLSREAEKEARDILVEFEEQYPNTLKTENIDTILEQLKRKRDAEPKK